MNFQTVTHGIPAHGYGAGQQAGGVQTPPRSVTGLRLCIAVTSLRASALSCARHLPRRLLMAAGVFLFLVSGADAQAVQGCAERDRIKIDLAEEFGQRRVAVMLSQGSVVEIYAHPDLGEWTALRVAPDGVACVIDFGEVFFAVDDRPPEGDPL
ncbi:hypothetical protein KZZ07_26390 [Mameliella sp. CS4]|uniref:hypothetical protein n=1 Tax=Mameliella sp. CS4 TaxID=2862329 RepID=UPI001C5FD501|nr:hypothetical protein [Mameliella sp. CS4]MBW4986060.1 hypothetical protein [Mameliella sp. CS4]